MFSILLCSTWPKFDHCRSFTWKCSKLKSVAAGFGHKGANTSLRVRAQVTQVAISLKTKTTWQPLFKVNSFSQLQKEKKNMLTIYAQKENINDRPETWSEFTDSSGLFELKERLLCLLTLPDHFRYRYWYTISYLFNNYFMGSAVIYILNKHSLFLLC